MLQRKNACVENNVHGLQFARDWNGSCLATTSPYFRLKVFRPPSGIREGQIFRTGSQHNHEEEVLDLPVVVACPIMGPSAATTIL